MVNGQVHVDGKPPVLARRDRVIDQAHTIETGASYLDASQTRGYCVAKDATHRAARLDPSAGKKRPPQDDTYTKKQKGSPEPPRLSLKTLPVRRVT